MTKCFLATVLLFILVALAFSAQANDLYLLKINSFDDYKNVISVVDKANGVIDGRFIVNINDDQYSKLMSSGIKLELLAENCRLENYYLILEEHNRIAKSAVSISPVYAIEGSQVAELEAGSEAVLGREGFMTFPLSEKSTPIFYNPPQMPAKALDDYPTDSIAYLIDDDSLYNYVTRMEDFYTRFTPSDSCVATRN